MEKSKKFVKMIKISSVFILIILVLSIIAILIFKYQVEGEKNLPFKLNKIIVVSTADKLNTTESQETGELIQKNNIYFYIEKNDNYKKQKIIKSIEINNFRINKKNQTGVVNIFKPADEYNKYLYTQENICDSIKYIGAKSTNTKNLEIGNQGGCIGFSIAIGNLGTYTPKIDEVVSIDGTLLAKNNITLEDITMEVTFDLIIETEQEQRFKANIKLKLPVENVLEQGICSIQNDELENIIFKRD